MRYGVGMWWLQGPMWRREEREREVEPGVRWRWGGREGREGGVGGGVGWRWGERREFRRGRMWVAAVGIGLCVVLAGLALMDDPPRRASRSGWARMAVVEVLLVIWMLGVGTHRQ